MDEKNKLLIFLVSFIIPLIFYRIYVLLNGGKVSLLRGITGLQIHHYHYGVLLVTIALILLLFNGVTIPTTIIAGLGLGTMLDSFISSLFRSVTRVEEIINYSQNLTPTIVLFVGISLISFLVYKRN